jgi:hypothetical protein
MNFNKLAEQINEVIRWNFVSQNGSHDFSNEKKVKQNDYVEEEAMETIAAIATKDLQEIFDGTGDILVTYSYLCFLCNPEQEITAELLNRIKYDYANYIDDTQKIHWSQLVSQVTDLVNMANYLLEMDDETIYPRDEILEELVGLLELMRLAYPNVDLYGAIDAILESNWSKFPLLTDQTPAQIEQECRWIEIHRKKNNVAASIVQSGDKMYIVFRDDHGQGKIMKPSTFAEPNFKV